MLRTTARDSGPAIAAFPERASSHLTGAADRFEKTSAAHIPDPTVAPAGEFIPVARPSTYVPGRDLIDEVEAGAEILFFPAAHATAAGHLTEDAIVVITATVSVRDGRRSLLGDQVTAPDLVSGTAGRPLTLPPLPVGASTPHTVRALRETLQRHPGPTDLRIDLIGARGPRLPALDPRFRITTSPALMGELKALFGPGCLR
ncbi:hypothetical protein [Nocardia grenadensis]